MGINNFTISGNLTRDPLLKTTESGKSIVTLDVASNYQWTDGQGQKQERVTYFHVKDFGKAAENHAQYLQKGNRVVILGHMQNNQYEKNGETVYEMDFIADQVEYPPRN